MVFRITSRALSTRSCASSSGTKPREQGSRVSPFRNSAPFPIRSVKRHVKNRIAIHHFRAAEFERHKLYPALV
jgi:hypothetical protein